MPHLDVAPHLSSDELLARFRASTDPVEKTHWQVLHLKEQGWRTEDVRAATGFSLNWIRKLVHRYNDGGPDAIADQRHHNPGQARLLSDEDEAVLLSALRMEPPPGGGLWNGPKVAAWMAERLSRPVTPQRGWDALRHLGWTPQRPRRRHIQTDARAQDRFQDPQAATSPRR